jgi:putative Holliday junction resolvase
MGRILSIDYGRKRTGLAVTDPLKIIANGLTTIPSHQVKDWITAYLSSETVETIVVGYPLGTDGLSSETARIYVDPFVNTLRKAFPSIPVVLEDERYTSKIAFQTMIDAGLKKKDRQNKETIDTVSATLILQSYLARSH